MKLTLKMPDGTEKWLCIILENNANITPVNSEFRDIVTLTMINPHATQQQCQHVINAIKWCMILTIDAIPYNNPQQMGDELISRYQYKLKKFNDQLPPGAFGSAGFLAIDNKIYREDGVNEEALLQFIVAGLRQVECSDTDIKRLRNQLGEWGEPIFKVLANWIGWRNNIAQAPTIASEVAQLQQIIYEALGLASDYDPFVGVELEQEEINPHNVN